MDNEDGFHNTIYEINPNYEIQYLLSYIKYDWIKSIQNVSKKII